MDQYQSAEAINSIKNNQQLRNAHNGSVADLNGSETDLVASLFEGDASCDWIPNSHWPLDQYQPCAQAREGGEENGRQQLKRRKPLQIETSSPLAALQVHQQLGFRGQHQSQTPQGVRAYSSSLLDPGPEPDIFSISTDTGHQSYVAASCHCWLNPFSDSGCTRCEPGAQHATNLQVGCVSMTPSFCPTEPMPQAENGDSLHCEKMPKLLQAQTQQSYSMLSEQQQSHKHRPLPLQSKTVKDSYQQEQAGLSKQAALFAHQCASVHPIVTPDQPPPVPSCSQGSNPLHSRLDALASLTRTTVTSQPAITPPTLPMATKPSFLPTSQPSLAPNNFHSPQTLAYNTLSPFLSNAGAPAQQAATGSSGQEDEFDSGEFLEDSDQGPPVDNEEGSRMVCQVSGCGKDLTALKDYHQRYHICDVHIRVAQVMMEGRLQRFCQQCGRFHDLGAFDGNRKSCRDQLSKHNARRRRRPNTEPAVFLPDDLSHVADDKSEIGRFLQALMESPFQLHALRILLGTQTHPALPAQGSDAPRAVSMPSLLSSTAVDPRTYDEAREILSGTGRYVPSYDASQRVKRLAIKLFNREPNELPGDVGQTLQAWLSGAPAGLETYIRPGCVFLTLDILLQEGMALPGPDALGRLVETLTLERPHPCWTQGLVALQLEDKLVMMRDGVTIEHHRITPQQAEAAKLPSLVALSPCCAVHAGPGGGRLSFELQGRHLLQAEIICRCTGETLAVHVDQVISQGTEGDALHSMLLTVQLLCTNSVVIVEANQGAFLSQAMPLLVVDDPAIASEINRLRSSKLDLDSQSAVLVDLGLVLRAMSGNAPLHLSHDQLLTRARHLLALACDQGWAMLVRRLLHIASLGAKPISGVANQVDELAAKRDGLGLMHRAVRSGNPEVVQELFTWGNTHGVSWPVDFGGPLCITPLHLAALQEGAAQMLVLLLDHSHENALTVVSSCDGVTPFQLAFQMGLQPLEALLPHLPHPLGAFRRWRQPSPSGSWKPRTPLQNTAPESSPWKPLAGSAKGSKKNANASLLGPCTVCASSLPLLLLASTTRCHDCQQRVGSQTLQHKPLLAMLAAALAAQGRASRKRGSGCASMLPWLVKASASQRAPNQPCTHDGPVVHQLVGLCQTCHAEHRVDVM